ncbi:MAG TPA: hypothetical protein DEQ61_08385 [Streptomyces sp.]|nr:hypothetical protein [Streptomyces sp.]
MIRRTRGITRAPSAELADQDIPAPRSSQEERDRAVRTVASMATGPDDCRLLLDALGLTPRDTT